ncbi:MAG: DUF1800 family protein [Phycisphaerales bacterium]
MRPVSPCVRVMQLAGAVMLAAGLAIAPSARAGPDHPAPRRTTIEVGSTRVIAVDTTEAAAASLQPLPEGSPLSILGPPRRAESGGRTFIRVRAEHPGETALRIGSAEVLVRVIDRRAPARPPVLIAPAPGAAVWGTFALAVEIEDEPTVAACALRVVAQGAAEPVALKPVSFSAPGWGPTRTAIFEIDTAAFSGECLFIEPVMIDRASRERAGEPVTLRTPRPSAEQVTRLEAEAPFTGTRPRRFPGERLSLGTDRACSGGRYLSNYAAEPAGVLAFTVERDGVYQVMGAFGGSAAAGALPTVSLVLDGAQYGATNARLLRPEWHRLALGVPITIRAGERILTPYFENDFYVEGAADRNLKTDYLEVLRIGDAPVADQASSGAMGSMTGAGQVNAMAGMVGGMMGGGGPAATGDDPYGERAVPMRIAFDEVLDGTVAAGDLHVAGRCFWPALERSPTAASAPVVSLVLNGRALATQRSANPKFDVPASAWRRGENLLQLRAILPGGMAAASPLQRVRWDGPVGDPQAPVVPLERFALHDPSWSEDSRARAKRGECDERAWFDLSSNGTLTLTLPHELHGGFDVLLEARGDHFGGAPIAIIAATAGDTTRELSRTDIPTWWGEHACGTVDLTAGEKSLTITFENDAHQPGKGDRNLFVQALVLRPRPAPGDATPPSVTLLYPGPRTEWTVNEADAVVIEAADDVALHEAELIVDGVQTGHTRWLVREAGPFVIPILARDLEPGPHTIAVRVRDHAGNTMTSEERTLVRQPPSATEPPTAYERAITLLHRFAFGPEERELATLLSMGEEPYLRARLFEPAPGPGELAALGRGLVYFRNPRSEYEVKGRALQQALRTTNPVRARFVLWAQNHFSTWINKTEGERKWREHVAFSIAGPGPFADLLFTSATGPAMLHYLDQAQSFAGKLNENYAREIMELHTLGVRGGYTQQDVTSLAHLLTGWTAAQEGDGQSGGEIRHHEFRFDPALSEPGPFTILGLEYPRTDRAGRYDRARAVIETLAAHPSTARFICTKLAAHYTTSSPDPALVERLSATFESTGGDLREVLLALGTDPAFHSASPPRLARPLDFVLRMQRTSRANNPWMAIDFLQRSGAGLFDRATPDGYPELDAAYADSNAIVQRWRLAHDLRWSISNLALPRARWGNADKDPRWPQRVIDSIAIRLTGRVLGPASNQAALDAAAATTGSPHDRVRAIGELVAKLPENNLR